MYLGTYFPERSVEFATHKSSEFGLEEGQSWRPRTSRAPSAVCHQKLLLLPLLRAGSGKRACVVLDPKRSYSALFCCPVSPPPSHHPLAPLCRLDEKTSLERPQS